MVLGLKQPARERHGGTGPVHRGKPAGADGPPRDAHADRSPREKAGRAPEREARSPSRPTALLCAPALTPFGPTPKRFIAAWRRRRSLRRSTEIHGDSPPPRAAEHPTIAGKGETR